MTLEDTTKVEAPKEPETDPESEPEQEEDRDQHDEPPRAAGPNRQLVVWIVVAVALVVSVAAFFIGRATGGGEAASADPHAGHAQEGDKASTWTCSMHPQIQAPEPGQCPICGMDLIPLADDGDAPAPDEVVLTERARVLARVKTAEVKPADVADVDLRLLGKVDYDETGIRTVTTWSAGRVDKLHVATTGQRVRRGQTIASLYSPEIYVAHQDLLVARRQVDRLQNGLPTARAAASSTLDAARERLRLLGVSKGQLARMEKARRPWRNISIRSTAPGTVINRLVSEGQYLKAGAGLYKVADLSKLWVQLDAYESDLPNLSEGRDVDLVFAAFPGESFTGRVAFIDPVVNARTRTTRVRVEVANPDGRLRPGMFAEARVSAAGTGGTPLMIPRTAPLFSGRRSIVYVELPGREKPTYQAREVRLGARSGDSYPVVAGLKSGEFVVVHGAFTLDADLQIRGGQSLMMRGDDRDKGAFDDAVRLPPRHRAPLSKVVGGYLAVHEALAADDLRGAKAAAAGLRSAVAAVDVRDNATVERAWHPVSMQLDAAAQKLEQAPNIDAARTHFEPLSKATQRMMQVTGNPSDLELTVAFCPMAFGNRGAEWVQPQGDVANPYFGKAMLQCGEKRDAIFRDGYLAWEPTSMPDSAPDSQPGSTPSSGATPAPASAPASTAAPASGTKPKATPRKPAKPAASGGKARKGAPRQPATPAKSEESEPAPEAASAKGKPASRPGTKAASSPASKPTSKGTSKPSGKPTSGASSKPAKSTDAEPAPTGGGK